MTLQIKNLKKEFGSTVAVNNISFELAQGDIIGFVGPNGAGKTTTLRILATLDEPTSGDVMLEGRSIMDHPELARQVIGFVPDSLPVQSDINVHEYLDFFARAYGIKSRQRSVLLDELEDFTNLKDKREKLLTTLSKGMKQRVSIARALIHDPKFILMDEPAAGLDPRARIELRELLRALSRQGKGILISSHILSELSEICNSALIIELGNLLRFGSIEDITNDETRLRKLIVRSMNDMDKLGTFLSLQPSVDELAQNGRVFEFTFSGSDDEACDLLKELIEKDYRIIEFRFKQQNLESVFMSITRGEVQ